MRHIGHHWSAGARAGKSYTRFQIQWHTETEHSSSFQSASGLNYILGTAEVRFGLPMVCRLCKRCPWYPPCTAKACRKNLRPRNSRHCMRSTDAWQFGARAVDKPCIPNQVMDNTQRPDRHGQKSGSSLCCNHHTSCGLMCIFCIGFRDPLCNQWRCMMLCPQPV